MITRGTPHFRRPQFVFISLSDVRLQDLQVIGRLAGNSFARRNLPSSARATARPNSGQSSAQLDSSPRSKNVRTWMDFLREREFGCQDFTHFLMIWWFTRLTDFLHLFDLPLIWSRGPTRTELAFEEHRLPARHVSASAVKSGSPPWPGSKLDQKWGHQLLLFLPPLYELWSRMTKCSSNSFFSNYD